MKINIKATNISLTPAISEYIEKKINTLNKFYKEDEEIIINVEVGKTTEHHKSGDIFRAEIHIRSRGNEYYASAETEDLYATIDQVKNNIVRELTSTRKRAMRLIRKGGSGIKNILRGVSDIGGKSWKRIRNKK